MKPLVKKMLTAVLCASTLTAPLFLSGCSFSKIANGVQQGAQKASQKTFKSLISILKQLVILTVVPYALDMLLILPFKN